MDVQQIIPHLSLPPGLVAWPHWMVWTWGVRSSNDKVPINPLTGRATNGHSLVDPCSFEQALTAYQGFAGYAGLAIKLGEHAGQILAGVDFDVDEQGELPAGTQERVARLATYTERSPRGGLHCLLYVTRHITQGKKRPDIEMYTQQKWFTVTLDQVNTLDVMERNSQFHALHAEVWPGTPHRPEQKRCGIEMTTSDDSLYLDDKTLYYAAALSERPDNELGTTRGRAFLARWLGETTYDCVSKPEGDRSARDYNLLVQLAYWTRRNAEQMERMFRACDCYSDPEKRKQHNNYEYYLDRTITRAIDNCYSVREFGRDKIPHLPPSLRRPASCRR